MQCPDDLVSNSMHVCKCADNWNGMQNAIVYYVAT